MKTQYSDKEIEDLVNDVKQAFLEPAFQALMKSQSEKEVKTSKEGGNGTTPTPDVKLAPSDGPRAETITQGQPSAQGSGSGTNAPTTKAEDDGSDKKPEPSSEPSAAAASEPSPEPSVESAPADSAPESQDPAMMGDGGGDAGGQPQDLVSAYSQLDDQSLKEHYEALKQVLMSKMGGDGSASAAPAQAPQAPQQMMMSELSKADSEKITKLEKSVEGLTELFSALLKQPKPKALTSQSELVKTENESLTKEQVEKRLLEKAKDVSLAKSDRELLLNYFTPRSKVKFADVQHLLEK